VVELRIVVAHGNDLVRRGISALLEVESNWRVREARNGREALELAKNFNPHIALLDMHLKGRMDGIETARGLRRTHPEIEIIFVGQDERQELIRAALDAGARAYLTTETAPRDLLAAVRSVASHETFVIGYTAEFLLSEYLNRRGAARRPLLSPRERQVLLLLAEGQRNKEVATILGTSTKTVETHRARIMRKLKIHSLAGLIRYALKHGLVQP